MSGSVTATSHVQLVDSSTTLSLWGSAIETDYRRVFFCTGSNDSILRCFLGNEVDMPRKAPDA